MSLIIKGMEMPKNCMECDLHFTARGLDEECIFSNDTVEDCTERRLYRCPLVEIPTPHGRLIDADRLMEVIEKNSYLLKGYYNSLENGMFLTGIKQAINEAPTIIEAEVSE